MSKRHRHIDHPLEPKKWLDHVAGLRGEKNTAVLHAAIDLYDENLSELQQKGLGIADILLTLELDNDTLAAAIAYPALQAQEVHPDTIVECLGNDSARLLRDVLQMQSLGKLQQIAQRGNHQLENLRKMLLAMVTDVRSVLIVLAERLWQLHQAKLSDQSEQEKLAQEGLTLYAPLANRLGILQLKWEIEDLSLRYLQPDTYAQLAKSLASRRDEREAYIQRMITVLTDTLEKGGVQKFQVSGRVKHIYSIYRKMQRKEANFEKIYDISALRVLVETVDDCYAVLGLLQSHWDQVPEEFDDYISQPKTNGYRSIHTVIIGPEQHYVEVQIRTYQMHQESELGVASHWRYKEGASKAADDENKIGLLRQIIAWHKDVVNSETKGDQPAQDLFADQVYVFTPTGDIMDLAKGATPLDFAYHIHSEVGHRCRGAKVNGHIVPLTYQLQTGERIEILTAKQPNPSRDWLNPHLGFLKTSRARAKVAHWFRSKDTEQNAQTGRELIEKEFKKHGLSGKIDLQTVAEKFHYRNTDDMLAALALGEIRPAQIVHQIQPLETNFNLPTAEPRTVPQTAGSNVQIVGIKNLLTQVARCCKPLPGDAIIGYITRARGVSVHRTDCRNVLQLAKENKKRLMEVSWSEKHAGSHPADLLIRTYDRTGLLRDITTLLASEKINLLKMQAQKVVDSPEVDIYLTIDISSREQLKTAIELLKKIPDVIELHRR